MSTYAGLIQLAPFEDANRRLLKNTAVPFYLPGTATPATLYTSRTKATPATNPVTTDAYGNLPATYADPGLYDYEVREVTLVVSVAADPAEPEPNWARFPAAIGKIYTGNGPEQNATRTTGSALGTIIAGGALYAYTAVVIDTFYCNIVTAGVGSLYRVGVWTIDNTANPFTIPVGTQYATLLRDVGTFDASTIGIKTLIPATAVTVPQGSWFVIGGVPQVTVCQPTIAVGMVSFFPQGQTNTAYGVEGAATWAQQSGVTGALGNLTPTAHIQIGHGVGFKRSA